MLEAKKIKSATVSTFPPSICHEVMGLDVMSLVFWMLSFKPAFSLSSFTLIKRLFSSFTLSAFQFSHSVMSNSLRPHELQHARPPCLSPTPGVHSNSCPLSRWCYPAISSSVILLPPIPPRIRVFSNESTLHMRWPKYWSFNFISPSNEYSGLISFRLTGLISLVSMGLSRVLSSTTVQNHQFFATQPSLWSSSHICTRLLEKP